MKDHRSCIVAPMIAIVAVTIWQLAPVFNNWLANPMSPKEVGTHQDATVLVASNLAKIEWYLPRGADLMPRTSWVNASSIMHDPSLLVDVKFDHDSGKLLTKKPIRFGGQRLAFNLMLTPRFAITAILVIGIMIGIVALTSKGRRAK